MLFPRKRESTQRGAMCMNKLKKIMQITNRDVRFDALKEYASKLGVSVDNLVNSRTGQTNEPELVARISGVERHIAIVRLTIIGIIVTVIIGSWSVIYTFWIYPPKYVLGDSSLHYGKWFGSWIKQEKRQNKQLNPYNNGAEFELHFVLRNIRRGEGEISKPLLVITAEDSNKEYKIKPTTSYVSSKKEGDYVTSTTVDLGRTIHVASYGIVDEFFEYRIGYEEKDQEIMDFLRINKDKLQFKIRGYPYKETDVTLSEEDIK